MRRFVLKPAKTRLLWWARLPWGTPLPDRTKTALRPSFFKAPVGAFLWDNRAAIALPFAGAIVGVLLSAGALLSVGLILSHLLKQIPHDTISFQLFLPLAFAGVAVGIGAYLRLYFSGQLIQHLWQRLFPLLLRAAFVRTQEIPLPTRIEKAEAALAQMMGPNLFVMLRSIFQGVGSLVMLVMFAPHWLVGLFGFIVLLSIPVVIYRFQLKPLLKELIKREGQQKQAMSEIDQGLYTINTFRATGFHQDKAIARQEGIMAMETRKNRIRAFFIATIISLISLFICGLLWASFNALASGDLSLDDLMTCCFFSILLAGSLNNGAEAGSAVMAGHMQVTSMMHDFMPIVPSPLLSAVPGTATLPPLKSLTLADVSFGYPGHANILHHVSVTLKQGESVAFLAPSGHGKTTLAHLILGLKQPTDGTILYDGIATTGPLSETRSVGYLPQELGLFSHTLEEQIVYGRPFDDAEIARVLALVGGDDFVDALAEGRQTCLNARDLSPLSRGQAQRIALARALYGSPEVLILDEPTSHLDTDRAEKIMKAILDTGRDRITVLITHALPLARLADHVFNVEGGTLSKRAAAA